MKEEEGEGMGRGAGQQINPGLETVDSRWEMYRREWRMRQERRLLLGGGMNSRGA